MYKIIRKMCRKGVKICKNLVKLGILQKRGVI